MRILVATHQTQGQHRGDFNHAIGSELVMWAVACDVDRLEPRADGGCGCGRAWVGLNSHLGTTTALVSEIDLTFTDYAEAVASGLDSMGFGRDGARRTAKDLAALSGDYPPGTVLGHRLGDIYVRAEPNSGERVA